MSGIVGAFISSFEISLHTCGNSIILSTTWARRYFSIAHCAFLKLWAFFRLFNEDSLLESPYCSFPTNPKQSSWAKFGTTPHWLNHVSHNLKHYSHILDPIIPENENQSRCRSFPLLVPSERPAKPAVICQIFYFPGRNYTPV